LATTAFPVDTRGEGLEPLYKRENPVEFHFVILHPASVGREFSWLPGCISWSCSRIPRFVSVQYHILAKILVVGWFVVQNVEYFLIHNMIQKIP
jgi:hypothetical protein